MTVFNWIRAEFAGGTDVVSDAPDDLALAIERALHDAGVGEVGCAFGTCGLPARELRCVFMRYATATAGTVYLHSVVWSGGASEPTPVAIERIFGVGRGGGAGLARGQETGSSGCRIGTAQACSGRRAECRRPG